MSPKMKIGEILVSKGLITREQLEEALQEQKERGGFLGQLLIEKGLVTAADVERAIKELAIEVEKEDGFGTFLVNNKIISQDQLREARQKQKVTHQRLVKIVSSLGFSTSQEMAQAISKFWDIPYVSLTDYEPNPDLMQLVPENIMRRHEVIPVKREGTTLVVAMVDPLDILAVDEIRLLTNYQIDIAVATEKDISLTLDRYFSIKRVAKEALLGMKLDELQKQPPKEAAPEVPTYELEEGPVIKLVDTIIDGGINAKASDIHLDPQEPEMRVRYRIDGILHDMMNVPKAIEGSVISRIKIVADMNIAEKRQPQDGHITIMKEGRQYDLRVSSFATIGGEKIVLRILDKSSMLLELSELGLSPGEQKIFQSLIAMPYGIILVTGPTGSGKTTTLYASLSKLNTLTKNIVTVEDPVEYKLESINQSQINPTAGITFAKGLRAILRQDPDIIMVGEIRDLETAEIAIHAALTGHLVFSTLHTNDASGAITRLVDMGIEPFLIASSVVGVVAQRLVRTICSDCKETYTAKPAELEEIGLEKDKRHPLARGKGCQYCLGTGYRGRIGIFEVMRMTEAIRKLITDKVSATAIKETAIKEGMSTLRTSALHKVKEGVTTTDEVRRVILAEEA
jgi:type IV pilus assembly protein PilB